MMSLVGAELSVACNLDADIKRLKQAGYSFGCIPMFHPDLKRDYVSGSNSLNKHYPIGRTDLVFQETDFENLANMVVGRISPWIDCDSPDDYYRRNSEKALVSELSWCAHIGLPAIQIALRRASNPNLARILYHVLSSERNPFRIWIQVPLTLQKEDEEETEMETEQEVSREVDSWHWWSQLISMCHENCSQFGVMLDVTANMPSDPRILDRWFSEPVAALRVSTSLFCNNRKGFPILTPAHQRFIKWFFKLNLQIVVGGLSLHAPNLERYQHYIHHLYSTRAPDDVYTQHAKSLDDCLQEPLQPLADNLSSATYTVFEMDPYKYRAYEQAVFVALKERHGLSIREGEDILRGSPAAVNGSHEAESEEAQEEQQGPTGDEEDKSVKTPTVIMVLGAGRGPLVDASIRAAKRASVPVKIYVVEKNPNAIITLRSRMDDDWSDEDIVFLPGDMRNHDPKDKADIFVSELLGSFGDNELSPECLYGAEKYLKSDGVSVPCSYTSYLAPMQSWKVYKEVTGRNFDRSKPEYAPFETPYVVNLKNCHVLTAPQPVFTFEHPKPDPLDDGSRFVTLTFIIEQDAIVHGLVGYFDSVLYGDVHMSTHPERHSPDMFSWFPLVFPLRNPVHVRAGDRFTVHMWRVVSPRGVWYEWNVTEPVPGPLHNPHGRSYIIGI